eukprot:SAG11_NODE_413_length_9694_cov_2.695675_1_plen_135_part_10
MFSKKSRGFLAFFVDFEKITRPGGPLVFCGFGWGGPEGPHSRPLLPVLVPVVLLVPRSCRFWYWLVLVVHLYLEFVYFEYSKFDKFEHSNFDKFEHSNFDKFEHSNLVDLEQFQIVYCCILLERSRVPVPAYLYP